MRKVIVSNVVTLDGRFSGPNGEIIDLRSCGTEFDDYNAERARAAGTLLMGRETWAGFRQVFGPAAADPDAEPVNRLFGELLAPLGKVVVSDSLPEALEGPWATETTLVRRADAHDHVDALRHGDGEGDILILASHVLWNDLLAAGLVDELHLTMNGDVFGGGSPLFAGAVPGRLRLIDIVPYPGCDAFLVRFAARNARP